MEQGLLVDNNEQLQEVFKQLNGDKITDWELAVSFFDFKIEVDSFVKRYSTGFQAIIAKWNKIAKYAPLEVKHQEDREVELVAYRNQEIKITVPSITKDQFKKLWDDKVLNVKTAASIKVLGMVK